MVSWQTNRYFQPLVNPDGYEYAKTDKKWIKNREWITHSCRGVDLFSNYGYLFNSGETSEDPCDNNFPGGKAFSELETKPHEKFFTEYSAGLEAFLTFHDSEASILYPYGGEANIPDNLRELKNIGVRAARVRSHGNLLICNKFIRTSLTFRIFRMRVYRK